MEGNNWRPTQGEPPSTEVPSTDWRSQLQPDARQRIVNKIMDTLRRHLPVPVPEGMTELKKIAVRFEEKIYTAAVNQSDYLRKISLKMLSMETKSQQNTQINPQPGVNENSSDTDFLWSSLVALTSGGVIDEEAPLRALNTGIVAQAALDVLTEEAPSPENKLVLHENVTVTPHLGASTTETQEGVAIEIADAVVGALKGELAATAVKRETSGGA